MTTALKVTDRDFQPTMQMLTEGMFYINRDELRRRCSIRQVRERSAWRNPGRAGFCPGLNELAKGCKPPSSRTFLSVRATENGSLFG